MEGSSGPHADLRADDAGVDALAAEAAAYLEAQRYLRGIGRVVDAWRAGDVPDLELALGSWLFGLEAGRALAAAGVS